MEIEVKSEEFQYNVDNPKEVIDYDTDEIVDGNWRTVSVITYPLGFPYIYNNQILYRLEGYSNRGFILDLTPKPNTVRRWCDLTNGDPIFVITYNNDVLVDLTKHRFEFSHVVSSADGVDWFWSFEYYDEKIDKDPNYGNFYTSSFIVLSDNIEGTIAYKNTNIFYFSDINEARYHLIEYERTYLSRIAGYFRNALRQV